MNAILRIYCRVAETTFKGELLFVLRGTRAECLARAEKDYNDNCFVWEWE